MNKGAYYKVPLSILKTGADAFDCLEGIQSVGLVYAGEAFRLKKKDWEVQGVLNGLACEFEGEEEENVLLGAHIMGLDPECIDCVGTVDFVRDIREQVRGEKTVDVSVKASYLEQALERLYEQNSRPGALSVDELRAVIAIASCMVKRGVKWRLISQADIRARASGFLRRADFAEALASKSIPGPFKPLSERQVKRVLVAVEAIGVIKRAPWGKGKTREAQSAGTR